MTDIPADKSAKDTHYAKLRRQFRDQKAGAPVWRERPAVGANAVAAGMVRLYGLHTVRAALDNPARVIKRMLVTKNALDRLEISDVSALPFPVEISEPKNIDKEAGSEAVHQGVVVEAEPLRAKRLDDLTDTSHRSPQCRRDHALCDGFQRRGADHHQPPFAAGIGRPRQGRIRGLGTDAAY
jgi:23S rRNA (guanosine2251-2'-O)-methyltransferase